MPSEAVRAALPASGALSTEMLVKALSPRLLHKTKSLPPVLLPPQFPPNPGEDFTRTHNCSDEANLTKRPSFYFSAEPDISTANTKLKAARFRKDYTPLHRSTQTKSQVLFYFFRIKSNFDITMFAAGSV